MFVKSTWLCSSWYWYSFLFAERLCSTLSYFNMTIENHCFQKERPSTDVYVTRPSNVSWVSDLNSANPRSNSSINRSVLSPQPRMSQCPCARTLLNRVRKSWATCVSFCVQGCRIPSTPELFVTNRSDLNKLCSDVIEMDWNGYWMWVHQIYLSACPLRPHISIEYPSPTSLGWVSFKKSRIKSTTIPSRVRK